MKQTAETRAAFRGQKQQILRWVFGMAVKFARSKRSSPLLNLTPLIDVLFQLLVFFMLTSTFLHPALNLKLPTLERQDEAEPETIIVSIDAEGVLRVNSDIVELPSLQETLKQRLAADASRAVHFEGHETVFYRKFLKVMEAARKAGATNLLLVHQEPSKKSTRP